MRDMAMELVVEACARAAHEANRAFSMVLGDLSHKSWDETPEWAKVSTRLGVRGVLESEYTAEQSHAAWVQHRKAEGWQHGDKKDIEKKIHPCLVPFKELPFELQAKDEMFVTVVKAMDASIWRIPQS